MLTFNWGYRVLKINFILETHFSLPLFRWLAFQRHDSQWHDTITNSYRILNNKTVFYIQLTCLTNFTSKSFAIRLLLNLTTKWHLSYFKTSMPFLNQITFRLFVIDVSTSIKGRIRFCFNDRKQKGNPETISFFLFFSFIAFTSFFSFFAFTSKERRRRTAW